jgi:HlyD family secretion protein
MAMSQTIPAWQIEIEAQSPEPSLRRIALASLIVIGIGFGGFFGWACIAQLDSAVPATGSIVVESKRKTVSLLDPGILKTLYVKEGDQVQLGQPLLRLDEEQILSQLGSLKAQHWTVIAKMTRLRAEQGDQHDIEFPPDLLAATADRAVGQLVANERRVFQDRWTLYEGTLAVQRSKISQSREQITALQAQIDAVQQRLGYTVHELEGTSELMAKGLATKTRFYELKRSEAEMRGNLGGLTAKRAETHQAIAQTELEMISTTNQRRQDISKDLQDAQSAAADLAEKIRGAEDTLAKRLVVAPDPGTVTDIKFFTPGSSIGAGQPILDIVPQNDKMIVEVNVRPEDIGHVHAGQKVNIRLTAYKQHKIPTLSGHLLYVSADRQQDPKGEPYFVSRAEIEDEALAAVKGIALYPGMPAEVLIINGERTAIDFFISPITDSLRRSFREE